MNLRIFWACAVVSNPDFASSKGVETYLQACTILLPQFKADELFAMPVSEIVAHILERVPEIEADAKREMMQMQATNLLSEVADLVQRKFDEPPKEDK